MKKNGFTLTELLAVIVVLSIIISICAVAISNTQKSILEQQKKNVIENILIKAEDYAHSNEFESDIYITVQELIDKGKLVPDNDGKITDPVEHKEMNCYTIKITYTPGGRDKKDGIYKLGTYDAEIFNENSCT